MERAECHTSRQFFDLFLRLLDNGTLDGARDRFASNGTFWSMLYRLGQERPEWIAEVVEHRLRRGLARMRSGGGDTAWARDDHDSVVPALIERSVKRDAAGFVQHVLPVVLEISDFAAVGETAPKRDRVWPVLFKTESFGLMDGCLWGLADSLATLGRNRIGDLREVIDELQRRDTYTANHLLLGLYRDAAATVADEAVMTLCDEPWRFECGFSDSPRWSATEVLRAVTPRCTSANRGRLENAILNYVPPFERSAGGYKDRGRACFTLLSAIPGELRSDTANARVRELARKVRGAGRGAPRNPLRGYRVADHEWCDGEDDG